MHKPPFQEEAGAMPKTLLRMGNAFKAFIGDRGPDLSKQQAFAETLATLFLAVQSHRNAQTPPGEAAFA